MKLQLDTTEKTITIQESVKLSELIDVLKKILPNDEWKKFSLLYNQEIRYWNNPIIIKEYPKYPNPICPPYPWITWSNTTSNAYQMNAGVYNLQLEGGENQHE